MNPRPTSSEQAPECAALQDATSELDAEASARVAIDRLVEDLGDVETVRIVVEAYLGELSSRASLLIDGSNESANEARRSAHTLRSTSALIGANHLALLCGEFEGSAMPDELLRERLATEIEAVEAQFTELLRVAPLGPEVS